MPAYTAAQLETKLSSYVEPNGDFYGALSQVLPRIYAAGLWRDLTYETSMSGADGYISLPADSEAVLACTINDNPRPVQSLWHDVRIVGRQAEVSPYFGIVDDGYYPVLLDMKDVQGVDSEDDVAPTNILRIALSGTTDYIASFAGTLTIATDQSNLGGSQTLTQSEVTFVEFEGADDFSSVRSIVYDNVPDPIDLIDPAYPTKVIATIPAGSGVIRYRRFRVSDAFTDTTVHLLLKRACPDNLVGSTIIHLGNLAALKHGLLGHLAENNADLQRAEYHWGVVEKLLDAELDAHRGSAKPKIMLNIWNNSAPHQIY